MAFIDTMTADAELAATTAVDEKPIWLTRRASARRRASCLRRARALAVRHCDGGPPDGIPMKTLYDLLGARADDDADELKSAFHKAVKANHPDLHPDDPDAAVRLSGILRAYAILRDPQERASYDSALAYESELLHRKPKRSVLDTLHNVFSEAVGIAVLAVALGGGYVLLANVLGSYGVKVAGGTAREPTKIAAVQPAAPASLTERGEPHSGAAGIMLPSIASGPSAAMTVAKSSDAPGIADDAPAPSLPERETAPERAKIVTVQPAAPTSMAEREEPHDDPTGVVLPSIASAPSAAATAAKGSDALGIADDMPSPSLPQREVAKETADPAVRTDQADLRTFTDPSVGRREGEPPDQGQTLNSGPNTSPTVRVELPSLEDDKNIPKSFSPNLVTSGQKRSPGVPDTKFLDAKTPKLRAHQKPSVAAIRPPPIRAAVKQASLENKNTSACYESQSCSSKSSPLLGVGF